MLTLCTPLTAMALNTVSSMVFGSRPKEMVYRWWC